MKKKNAILLTGILFLLLSCNDKKSYFHGDIILFDQFESIDSLCGVKIELSDIYAGGVLVYDSLILFSSQQYPDCLYYVFSLNSKKRVGSFCGKGQGPNEYFVLGEADQFSYQNKEISLWIRDVMKEKILLLNLTKSIANNETVIDTIIQGNWVNKFSRPFSFSFVLNNGLIALKNQPEIISTDDIKYIPGSYFIYDIIKNEEVTKYILYDNSIINLDAHIVHDNYLHSIDRIKPDKSKIAMAMTMLSQINILDIEMGKLTGIRLKDTPDFENLTRQHEGFKTYYQDICVDDEYIYGLYSNVLLEEKNFPFVSNELHVFDWNGNPVRKIILDEKYDNIALDPIRKLLYAKNNEDDIYCYQVGNLQ